MNKKRQKLIALAATVDLDGEGWRDRLDKWLGLMPVRDVPSEDEDAFFERLYNYHLPESW